MATLRPTQTSHHRQQSSHVPVELQDCRFVFIRHDAHRTPLQCTYDGPFRVLERATKYFTLDLKGKRDTVSVDRLKPAFLDDDWGVCGEPVTPPPTHTQPALRLPPSSSAKEACVPRSRVDPPLTRSRRGRVIKLQQMLPVSGVGSGGPLARPVSRLLCCCFACL